MIGAAKQIELHPERSLEVDELSLPLGERLGRAASRLRDGRADLLGPGYALRRDQARVFEDFAAYLTAGGATAPLRGSFARIVLPPRTGKTVLAGHIIGRCGLTTTVIVPTRTLVQQTTCLLADMLPGVPIGELSGEEDSVVSNGINVTTYAMLHRRGPDDLPEPLRRSALVFVDEAHRAMTPECQRLLRLGFAEHALRIGLTATPDYDGERRLCRVFPDLIHELSLGEALAVGLLAPVRVWVAEVDCEKSAVRMALGEYDAETLGRLMSRAPFFKAAELFRYSPTNRNKAALICCATRQQAYDLAQYLRVHRAPGTPAPEVILGETTRADREDILARFERGAVDTLVQVGVLIEGWSSPRCKLLVDLAPSVSRVRAMQKYFRAMTRWGGEQAHLYVLLPSDLPELPTLPTDLFGTPVDGYVCGDLIGDEAGTAKRVPITEHERTPVAGVRLRQRILLSTVLRRPRLRRGDLRGLSRVLRSCPELDLEDPPGLYRFRGLLFQHRQFTGRGAALMEWLGFTPTSWGYQAFLVNACPGLHADRLLRAHGPGEHCILEEAAADQRRPPSDGEPNPLEGLLWRERVEWARSLMKCLKPRDRTIIERRLGLCGEDPLTFAQIGQQELVSGWRVSQIAQKGVRLLRLVGKRRPLDELALDAGRTCPPALGPAVHGVPPAVTKSQREWAARVLPTLRSDEPMAITELVDRLGVDYQDVAAGLHCLLQEGRARATARGYVTESPTAIESERLA